MIQGKRYRQYLFDENSPVPKRTVNRRQNYEISTRQNNKNSDESNDDDVRMDENEIANDSSTTRSLSVLENGTSDSSGRDSPTTDCITLDSSFASLTEDEEGEVGEEFLLNQINMNSNEADDDDVPEIPILYKGARINRAESEALIMAFVLNHSLSEKGLRHLLELLNCHMPVPAYSSKFTFLKKFPVNKAKKNFFCKDCEVSLDFGGSDEVLCECKTNNVKKHLIKDNKYFISLPIKEKLKDFLNKPELRAQLNVAKNHTSDVTSGQLYRRLEQNGVIGRNDITLQFNTDGVKAFKSTNASMGPLFVAINELPLNTRRDYTILAGLFIGNSSPRMDTFLKPLITELGELHRTGLVITSPNRDDLIVRVHTIVSPVDSVASCNLTYSSQFNGEYGCLWCLNKGYRIPKGKGHCRIYMPFLGDPRTKDKILADAERAVATNKPVNGIKGFSPLLELPVFDIVSSFTPEYMHAGLLGVISMFFGLLFDSTHSKQPWSLSKWLNIVSHRLEDLKPVSETTRLPYTLDKRGLFKASEWHSIMLYYSLIVFRNVMEEKYLAHWFLLVYGFRKLLKNNITELDIYQAEESLKKIVKLIGPLYSLEDLSFNAHLLLHMANSVRDWGALWASSTFGFEHCNGILTRFFNGTRSVLAQIHCSYERRGNLIKSSKQIMTENTCRPAYELFYNLIENRKTVKNFFRTGQTGGTLLGRGRPESMNCHDRNAIQLTIPDLNGMDYSLFSYKRFIFKGTLYCGQACKKTTRRDNSVVQLIYDQYMEVKCALEVRTNDRKHFLIYGSELVLSNEFEIEDESLGISSCDFVWTVKRGVIIYSFISSVKQKCLRMVVDDIMYVTPLANSFERD